IDAVPPRIINLRHHDRGLCQYSITLRLVGIEAVGGKEFYRLKTMGKKMFFRVREAGGQIAMERHTSHRCAVAMIVMIVHAPIAIEGIHVVGRKGGLNQRMSAIYASVKEAH